MSDHTDWDVRRPRRSMIERGRDAISRHVDSIKRRFVARAARESAERIVGRIVDGQDGLGGRTPPTGFMRGIDYYDRKRLIRTVADVLAWYRSGSGRFPDLIEPRLFSEKLIHALFFAEMKVPESGNKSLTARFIPTRLDGAVRCPSIVWRSRRATLPPNHHIAAGVYYLKTNHGSSMVRRVVYPLSRSARISLEWTFSRFLRADYGEDMGEWWYNVFDREVILEEAVCLKDPPTTLLFFVVSGEVVLICADRKSLDAGRVTQTLLLDPDFNVRGVQKTSDQRLSHFDLSADLKHRTKAIAREIGAGFSSIRVDLLVGDDGQIYLNEITHASNGGFPFHDAQLDLEMGTKWVGNEIYRRDGT